MDNRFESLEEATEHVTNVVFMQNLRKRILALDNSGNKVDSELLSVFYDLVKRIERERKTAEWFEETSHRINMLSFYN